MTLPRIRTSVGLLSLMLTAATTPLAAQQGPPLSAAAQQAAARYQAADWPGAVDAYRTVVAAEPGNGIAWLRLGRALVEIGRNDEALEALEHVPGTGLQTPFLFVYRARAYTAMGRTGAALDALEEIQPSPALGGAAAFRQQDGFAALEGQARYEAFLHAVEAAAFPCRDDPMNREFDFWVGEWDVFVGGQQAGTNRVEPMLQTCVLLENWTSAGGREGKSFNWVDRSSGIEPRWRQLWVADQGNTLDYERGRFQDGVMRFEGHTMSPQGDTILQRLDFAHVHADTVRQIFHQSTDGGQSWQTTWEGLYIRKKR